MLTGKIGYKLSVLYIVYIAFLRSVVISSSLSKKRSYFLTHNAVLCFQAADKVVIVKRGRDSTVHLYYHVNVRDWSLLV